MGLANGATGEKAAQKRLLVYTTYTTTPGQRFRMHEWIPGLAAHGTQVEQAIFSTPRLEELSKVFGRQREKSIEMVKSIARLATRRHDLRSFDGAFIYREMVPVGPPIAELALIRRGGIPVATDVDDPIFLAAMAPNSRSPLARFVKDPSRVARFVKEVDVFITINDAIAEWASPFARRIHVIPNVVALERYPVRTGERAPGPVRLGFSGSPSTTIQLDAIRDALDDVDREIDCELRVMGGKTPCSLARGKTVEIAWSAETEAAELGRFDIGLAPAPDEELYRYKSPVKVLLYMAMGLPVVTSPYGQAGKVVEHGVTGFHAATRHEWRDALLELARDPDLRARMGAAGRAVVEREFSREAIWPKVTRAFDELFASR